MIAPLATDGYKLDHRRQYPIDTEYVYASWIPRSNRHLSEVDKVVVFGIQYAVLELNKYWRENFFNLNWDVVESRWRGRIDSFLGKNNIGFEHLHDLHKLGHLPIVIQALPEGTVTPLGCPHLTIRNSNPKFAWIVNFLETYLSLLLWRPSTSASIARQFRKNLEKHVEKTGWNDEQKAGRLFLCHDFSMRGMDSLQAAISSGMGHLTCFTGSDTLPAAEGFAEYYDTSVGEFISGGIPATEHSVMCAGGDENEINTFKRLLEIYPEGFLSIVSDTWDYWNVITSIVPQLKNEILARDGRLVIRPDSGDPVDIICGIKPDFDFIPDCDDPSYKGTYELLWEQFGGYVNEKGYKVLDSHIGIIYGDAITLKRQAEIYKRLEEKGFAATNLCLGIGSYTYGSTTRDSLGWALKTQAVCINGEWREVYKDPKTVIGMPKKSLRGFVAVEKDKDNNYIFIDKQQSFKDSELRTIFMNGILIRNITLSEIRENIDKSL